MGDAAFGMIGMDVETAARCRIPIVTIVMNNGLMGGYGEWCRPRSSGSGSNRLGGGLRGDPAARWARHTELVHRARPSCAPALERSDREHRGRPHPPLVEVMTHEEHALALGGV